MADRYGTDILADNPVGVEENAPDFAGNALIKMRAIARRHAGEWAMADDSGLEVRALGGAPGVRSARYAGRDGDTPANNALLLANLAGVADRAANFTCAIALVDPEMAEVGEAEEMGGILHAAATAAAHVHPQAGERVEGGIEVTDEVQALEVEESRDLKAGAAEFRPGGHVAEFGIPGEGVLGGGRSLLGHHGREGRVELGEGGEGRLDVQDVVRREGDVRALAVEAHVAVGEDVGWIDRHFVSPLSSSSCFRIFAALR